MIVHFYINVFLAFIHTNQEEESSMAYVIFQSCHYELVRFVHSVLSTFATDSRVCVMHASQGEKEKSIHLCSYCCLAQLLFVIS